MIADGLVMPAFDGGEPLPQLAALAERFVNQKPDLADLC